MTQSSTLPQECSLGLNVEHNVSPRAVMSSRNESRCRALKGGFPEEQPRTR